MDIGTRAAVEPSQEQLIEVIAAALGSVLERDLGPVTGSTRLFDDIGMDSTNVLDLMMALEESLDLEFYTDDLELSHFATVGKLAEFIAGMLAA
jgi:acyl carrier protein